MAWGWQEGEWEMTFCRYASLHPSHELPASPNESTHPTPSPSFLPQHTTDVPTSMGLLSLHPWQALADGSYSFLFLANQLHDQTHLPGMRPNSYLPRYHHQLFDRAHFFRMNTQILLFAMEYRYLIGLKSGECEKFVTFSFDMTVIHQNQQLGIFV